MLTYTSNINVTDHLLFKCIYCNKCRNKTGYWKQAKVLDMLYSEDTSHGICPICFQKYFPEEFSSLCEEGVITINKTVSSDNRVTYEIFYQTGEKAEKDIFGKYIGQQHL